jgi:ADP-heptose:LPS heptosyltransferase
MGPRQVGDALTLQNPPTVCLNHTGMDLILARHVDRLAGPPLTVALRAVARLRGERLAPLRATTPPVAGPLSAPRRVLAMKFYGLGNIALILPVLEALRRAVPGVEIDFLTLPGNTDLLTQSGLVRRVLTVDVKSFGGFLRSAARLPTELRQSGYDTVLDFEQFLKISTVFAFLTGAPRRIGLATEGQRRGALLTTRVAYTDTEHTAELYARLVAPFGVAWPPPEPWQLPVPGAARAAAWSRLSEAGVPPDARVVVLHVGTGPNFSTFPLKRWECARFAALADALLARHNVVTAFTGVGSDERALVAQTIAAMQHPGVDLCDRLDVAALTGLLAEAALVVSNDTSVMHVAGLVGAPVVALFGPTSPRSYGPRARNALVYYKAPYCSPCITNYNLKISRCTDNVCMRSIGVDEVLAGIERDVLGPCRLPTSAGAAGRVT